MSAMHEMSDPFASDENGCLSFGQSFLFKFKTIFVLHVCKMRNYSLSSKSLIHMVWKLLKMSHLNFGIFHHFLCD